MMRLIYSFIYKKSPLLFPIYRQFPDIFAHFADFLLRAGRGFYTWR
jgi:hypothetical protein